MIDIELACGWRVVGTTARPRGVQVLDSEGNVVKGVAGVEVSLSPHGFPGIQVALLAKLTSESLDPPAGAPLDPAALQK